MVKRQEQDSGRRPFNQGVRDVIPEPNRINASTPYDFNGRNLTPYGGLLPVITMLDKLGFQALVEQTLTSQRIPRAMDLYRFVLGIVLGLYIGFPRLNQLRFIARDPLLTGILKVTKLPVQSTFWRFINALHDHRWGHLRLPVFHGHPTGTHDQLTQPSVNQRRSCAVHADGQRHQLRLWGGGELQRSSQIDNIRERNAGHRYNSGQ
jgi:hypothetical protein